MDPLSQLTQTLLDGVDQGAAKVVVIGTSAAAAAAWNRIRSLLRPRRPSLELAEREVLAAEPGEEVDRQALLRLLQMLSPEEMATSITVHGDYVARDKNQIISVQGDYIGRDKH
jgi:hypothetical protein